MTHLVKAAQVKWSSGAKLALLLALVVTTLPACSARWHLRKAIAKDPSILLEQVVKVDTIVVTQLDAVHDTFVTSKVDTITIEKERLRLKIMRSYDTIEVDAACLPDTIRITKEVRVPQVLYKEDGWEIGKIGLSILVLALLAIFVAKIFGGNR